MKRFLIPLFASLALPNAVNTEDKIDNITSQHEFNSLSQYGIIDYASAVSWCEGKIYENHFDYELKIENIYEHPAYFCREHFIPSIQTKSSRICAECDLDPNLILANLVEAIKFSSNHYDSDIVLSEELYSEGNINQPNYIYENSESISDKTDKNEQSFPYKPDENNKTLSDKPKENSKSISDQHDQKRKGTYFISSIGLSKISDIKVQDTNSDIEFDTSLGFDIGIGYDFGQNRLEASWARGQSDKVSLLGHSIESDSRIDSLLVSYYYDFRDNQKWSPFIGASIGSTNVDIDGVEDIGMTYGFGYGLSYKTSEIVDVFIKGQTMVFPELNFGTISIENGNYTNGTIGIRYRF